MRYGRKRFGGFRGRRRYGRRRYGGRARVGIRM